MNAKTKKAGKQRSSTIARKRGDPATCKALAETDKLQHALESLASCFSEPDLSSINAITRQINVCAEGVQSGQLTIERLGGLPQKVRRQIPHIAALSDALEAFWNAIVDRAVSQMSIEETDTFPPDAFAKVRLLAKAEGEGARDTETRIEYLFRNLATITADNLGEEIAFFGAPPQSVVRLALQNPDNAELVAMLNRWHPGYVLELPGLSIVVRTKLVEALTSLNHQTMESAKLWLQTVLFPNGPSRDRLSISDRHFAFFLELYKEVVFLRELIRKHPGTVNKDTSIIRAVTNRFGLPSRGRIERWMKTILPTRRGEHDTFSRKVGIVTATILAQSAVGTSDANIGVMGPSPRQVYNDIKTFDPDWKQTSLDIKRGAKEAAKSISLAV